MLTRFLPFGLCLLFILIGIARIAAGYPLFTQTYDEQAHLATGMQLLDQHRYDYETLHPPLARILIAALPYLNGLSPTEADYAKYNSWGGMWVIGNEILYKNNQYFHNLTLARIGILPFYVIAVLTLWAWCRKFYGTSVAVAATLLFSTMPVILGHSMVATTDMALTAMLMLALFAGQCWLEHPSFKQSVYFGIASGLALLSKMSALIFLPICIKAIMLYKQQIAPSRQKQQFKHVALILACLSLTVWTGYLFVNFPAYLGFERLIDGFDSLLFKQMRGQGFYFLGELNGHSWYYFPLVLAIKTPIAFLLLLLAGIAATFPAIRGKQWTQVTPLIIALLILMISSLSRINIGIRHILCIYPFLSILAGYGAVSLWQKLKPAPLKLLPVLLIGWHLTSSLLAHPYYISYFNELVTHPEEIVLDSDLDWGQDLYLLSEAVKARHITLTALYYRGMARPDFFGLPSRNRCYEKTEAQPAKPASGWYAISFGCLKATRAQQLAWLAAYKPVARIGSSIMLYHIP